MAAISKSTAQASLSQHDADIYRKNANFVYSDAFAAPVLGMLSAKEGERIADLGCGSGELTAQLCDLVGPKGRILGLDSNQNMLDKASVVLADKSNISLHPPVDCQAFTPAAEDAHSYDAVFSNAVLHWCKRDPGGTLETVKGLLKPGGRFAAEMGGYMCLIGVRGALHGALRRRGVDPKPLDPWYFPSEDEYTELLLAHGFKPEQVSLHTRPTPLPTDLRGWLLTFARSSFLSSFDDAEAEAIMAEVVEDLRPDCQDWQGKWTVMYMRLRVLATAP